jgi:hypothetical protein
MSVMIAKQTVSSDQLVIFTSATGGVQNWTVPNYSVMTVSVWGGGGGGGGNVVGTDGTTASGVAGGNSCFNASTYTSAYPYSCTAAAASNSIFAPGGSPGNDIYGSASPDLTPPGTGAPGGAGGGTPTFVGGSSTTFTVGGSGSTSSFNGGDGGSTATTSGGAGGTAATAGTDYYHGLSANQTNTQTTMANWSATNPAMTATPAPAAPGAGGGGGGGYCCGTWGGGGGGAGSFGQATYTNSSGPTATSNVKILVGSGGTGNPTGLSQGGTGADGAIIIQYH